MCRQSSVASASTAWLIWRTDFGKSRLTRRVPGCARSTRHLAATPFVACHSGDQPTPEVFEKKFTETFGDIDGVHIIFDDLIIAAVEDDDHDCIFRTLLERCEPSKWSSIDRNYHHTTNSAKLLRLSLALAEFDLDNNILRAVRIWWLIFCHKCEVTALYAVLCECDTFSQCAKLSLLADELCWLDRVWTVARQPRRRQPCVRDESCCLCYIVVSGTVTNFVYLLMCILFIVVCIWICDFKRCV